MNESIAAEQIEYRDLIKEVYIDPIRTVVVIDDEFPSLDGLIEKELKENKAWDGKLEDVKTVKKILQFCREKDKPWLVDVHNGKKDEIIAPHLIHSDLMILDFHLNDDGEKAIKILKKLANSDHFNMVIVYTNGDPQTGGDIDTVVRDITLGLTYRDENLRLCADKEADVKFQISVWEDEEDEIYRQLRSEITEQSYLNYRAERETDCSNFLNQDENKILQELFSQLSNSKSLELADLIKWLFLEKEKTIQSKLSDINLGHVSTASPSADINWIRTDRLFVTVVNKHHQPSELPEKLLDALHQWCPEPHRLLMSQMRFLIENRGVIAESGVLGKHYIQVGWLQELLNSTSHVQTQVINNTITRHWEALGDELRNDIKDFVDRLVSHLTSQKKMEVLKKYSKVDIQKESENIAKHINCYNCTKPIDGYHLTTGHILELDTENEEKEYWICLSPACDLVPGQKEKGLIGRVKHSMPFMAVKLEKTQIKTAIKNINYNIFIFLEICNEICAFTFHPEGSLRNNPIWEQMIAEKKGIFETKEKELHIWRPGRYSEDSIIMEKHTARVAAQLQYEYALNLLQRFGAVMTRVGLDFSKPN